MKKPLQSSQQLLLIDDDDPMQMAVSMVQVGHIQAPGYVASIEIFAQFNSSERYLTISDMRAMRDWLDAELRARGAG